MTEPLRRPVVAFQGSRDGRSAFARINAEWSRRLEAAGYRVESFVPGAGDGPDVMIHHDFATPFTGFTATTPPPERRIAVRTWDFGPLPPAWVEKINREFGQYWAHSTWIAAQAREAGIDPDRIRVVPHGIDPDRFRPDGPRLPIATAKRFRFLFVGGVSLRKGTDILLEAYARAFSAGDDVCLVLKDHSGDLFYRENHARARIAELRATLGAPEILHLDGFLPDEELAALYRACDVAVFPYRAEGFCLPILEAMASGVPALVPRFGACLDFCRDETSWLLRARRIRAPVTRQFSVALGFTERLEEVDFCEIEVGVLAEALRSVFEASSEVRRAKAEAGVAAASRLTWTAAGAQVVGNVAQLLASTGAVFPGA